MTAEERELNEKLAVWIWGKRSPITWWADDQMRIQPVGRPVKVKPFTQSIDSLVKHIFPKLDDMDTYRRFTLTQDFDCPEVWIAYFTNSAIREINGIPALACARAIAKYVDEVQQ